MIRTDKYNKEYMWVNYCDIIIGLNYASKEKNNEMINLLNQTIINMDVESEMFDKKEHIKLKKEDKVIVYLLEKVKIDCYDTYIDQDILNNAFTIAYYEFNHEMRTKLSKYFRIFTNNEIKGISNEYLKQEIINDKEVLEYIKKYDNFNEYVKEKAEKNNKIFYSDNRKKLINKRIA